MASLAQTQDTCIGNYLYERNQPTPPGTGSPHKTGGGGVFSVRAMRAGHWFPCGARDDCQHSSDGQTETWSRVGLAPTVDCSTE